MEDEEAWPAARLRDCQISRDLSVLALEFNHRHLSHRRDGRVADSTLEPTLERTPQVDAATEDPKEDVSRSAGRGPRFVQGRGPRGAVYVAPSGDVAVVTLGRSPRNPVLAAAVKVAGEKAKRAFRVRKAKPERVLSDRAVGVNFREL